MEILLKDVTVEANRDEDGVVLSAKWRRYHAGKADCVREEDGTMLLSELRVDDAVPRRSSFFNLFGLAENLPPKIDFRSHCIGSLLLERAVSEARAAGAAEIHGTVTHYDLLRTPFLLDMYLRHGFVKSAPDEEWQHAAAWKITLKL